MLFLRHVAGNVNVTVQGAAVVFILFMKMAQCRQISINQLPHSSAYSELISFKHSLPMLFPLSTIYDEESFLLLNLILKQRPRYI